MASLFTVPEAPTKVMTTRTVCSIPELPAPSISPSCEQVWKRLNDENESCVVYGLAWHEHYLVAVTSNGQVCTWNVPTLNQQEELYQIEDMDVFQKCHLALVKVQVSSGVLYSVDFHTTGQHRTLLIVSGDEGILGFDWNAILEGNTTTLFRCKPHYTLSTVEINDFSITKNFIFGAAGDANGYKWDLETSKLIAMYPSAKRGYLHSIECMQHDSTVLLGGEDGVLGIWDGHHDKLIENMDLQSILHKDAHVVEKDSSVSSSITSLLDPSKSSIWISRIHSPSDNWWTVCGGILHSETTSAAHHGAAGGHILSFHAPTRSLVAGCLTRETLQYSCSSTPGTLVTAANEGVVSHWTPSSLQRRGRVWCSPPSCFAAAIGGGTDNVLAVGGVGNQVDIFNNVAGNKSYSLEV